MTVSTSTNRWSYTGNGVTTVFAYTTKIFAASDLKVYLNGTLQNTGYSVVVGEGGTVTFGSAPGVGVIVLIVRDVPFTQPTDLLDAGPAPMQTIEAALDRVTILTQQNQEGFVRSFRLQTQDPTVDLSIPLLADRASKFLAFASDGTPIASGGTTDIPVSSVIEPFISANTLSDARDVLELGDLATLDTVDTGQIDDGAVTFAKVDSGAIASQAEAQAGTATNKLMTPERTAQAIAALSPAPVIGASYASSNLTIGAAGTHTLTHGLGGVPLIIQYFLVCTDAGGDAGYTQNQTVHMAGPLFNHVNAGGAEKQGASVLVTSTQIIIRFADSFTFTILHPTTGAVTSADITKWALVVRAFA